MATGNPNYGNYTGSSYGANAAEIAARAGMGGQYVPAPTGRVPMVYMGKPYEKPVTSPYYGSTTTAESAAKAVKNQAYFTLDAADQHIWSLQPEERDRLGDLSSRIVGWDARGLFDTQRGLWGNAVQVAAMRGGETTPWDVLEENAADAALRGSSGSGGGGFGGGGGGSAGPSVVVNLTNPSDAQALVDQALQQYLGRDASPKERDRFLKLLNQAEAKNPLYRDESLAMGGLNPQQAAKEFAMSRDDAAEFMVNTQYMDWFMEKIARDETEGIESGL